MTSLVQSSPIAEIDLLTKAYAKARSLLSERVNTLNAELRAIHTRKIEGIKSALAAAADTKAQLVALLQQHPELFVRPRTMTLNGIKVGYGLGKGRVDWDDDESVVARAKKLLDKEDITQEQFDLAILTKHEISSAGLRTFDARTLARLGVTVEGTGDVVIVKTEDGAVDKLVKRILKEGAQEGETAA